MSIELWRELDDEVAEYIRKRSAQVLIQKHVPEKAGVVDKVSKFLKVFRENWRDATIDCTVGSAIFGALPIPKTLEAEIVIASKIAAVYGRYMELNKDAFLSEEVRDEIIEQAKIIKAPAALIAGLFKGSSDLVKAGLDRIGMTQENIERALVKSVEQLGTMSPEAQEEAIWGELIPKIAAKATGGCGVKKKAIIDKKAIEKEALEFLGTGKDPIHLPEEVKNELANLKAFLEAEKSARTFNNFAVGFSHMQEFGTRFHLPIFSQIGAFGSKAFSLVSSMKEVSKMQIAGSLLSIEGASGMFCMTTTAASLMSLFIQEDAGNGLIEILDLIMPALQSISHQLGDLKTQLAAFQAQTLYEFHRASFELSLVHASLSKLSSMNMVEIKNLRKATDFCFNEVIQKIQDTAAEIHYRLEELQFEPLREAVDVIEFADTRSIDLATLKKAGSLIERWLSAPPCSEIVNGGYFTKTSFNLSSFLKLSLGSLTGPIALFAKENEIAGLEPFHASSLINPEFFGSLIPSYIKYLKTLKARGEVYDIDRSLFESKLQTPLNAAVAHHEILRANRHIFEKLFTKLDMLQAQKAALLQGIADEKGAELIVPIYKELVEANARASILMQKPLWELTRHAPYHGGWCISDDYVHHSPFWIKKDIGKLVSLLAARQLTVSEKGTALKINPISLVTKLEQAKDAVSLEGRLAEVSIHDPKVYLYPTYLPLKDIELIPEIKDALVAEKAGLGKLEVKAIVTQEIVRNYGLYFVNASPYFSKDEKEFLDQAGFLDTPVMLSAKDLSLKLEFAFLYQDSGNRHILLNEMYTLETGADPYTAYQVMWGGSDYSAILPEHSASWNGDALSVVISSRFENKRKLNAREINASHILELKTKTEEQFERLRTELFDESTGNPLLKKRLKETKLQIEKQVVQIYSFAKYLWGIDVEKGDLENLIKIPIMKHNETLLSPHMGYIAFKTKYLERTEIDDPIFKLLKTLETRIQLGYQEVLSIKTVRKEEAPILEAAALALKVKDLTKEVALMREETREISALREENRELKAMMQIMMKQMQMLSESLSSR